MKVENFIGFWSHVVLDLIKETLIGKMSVRRKKSSFETICKARNISGSHHAHHSLINFISYVDSGNL